MSLPVYQTIALDLARRIINQEFWLYNKCCGLDENQGYNIYFFCALKNMTNS